MIDDQRGYSHAPATLEPAEVGRERPEDVAAEDETDVEGSTGVANGAGNREGGCVGRDEQYSGGGKNRGKHDVDFFGFCGFCATTATKQGVEGWTLSLKSPVPHIEALYVLGDRGLVKGVAERHRGAQG